MTSRDRFWAGLFAVSAAVPLAAAVGLALDEWRDLEDLGALWMAFCAVLLASAVRVWCGGRAARWVALVTYAIMVVCAGLIAALMWHEESNNPGAISDDAAGVVGVSLAALAVYCGLWVWLLRLTLRLRKRASEEQWKWGLSEMWRTLRAAGGRGLSKRDRMAALGLVVTSALAFPLLANLVPLADWMWDRLGIWRVLGGVVSLATAVTVWRGTAEFRVPALLFYTPMPVTLALALREMFQHGLPWEAKAEDGTLLLASVLAGLLIVYSGLWLWLLGLTIRLRKRRPLSASSESANVC